MGERQGVQARETRARKTGLNDQDRALLALLGVCRYLTLGQVLALLGGQRDIRTVENRLRAMAGDSGNVKLPRVGSVALRRLPFRAFDGRHLVLWTPTAVGYAVARRELQREVKVPRVDVGAAFAEHFVALADFFVGLTGPYFRSGVPSRDLPFSWDVSEETHLPWREFAEDGRPRDRVILPDAVLEIPFARRRLFIECEMGTHTLVAVSRDKSQATVRKAERYETFLAGLADVPSRTTHYARKYTDGWPAEVLFLVPNEARRASTEAALATVVAPRLDQRVCFRAFTLEKALAHVQALLPRPPEHAPRPTRAHDSASSFYGEDEHRAVKDFVVEMTAALARANGVLRRNALPEVDDPVSTPGMLAFLRKVQAIMQRQRGGDARRSGG